MRFYRLMTQALRRCKANFARPLTVGSLTEHGRECFTERPLWWVNGRLQVTHPEGYVRSVDAVTGAFSWGHELVEEVLVVETDGFW
jgi:hypothetical protein